MRVFCDDPLRFRRVESGGQVEKSSQFAPRPPHGLRACCAEVSVRAMPQNTIATTAENVLSAVEACLDSASAEALARLRAPAELQARIETLADQCTGGQLTEEEREEYETLVRLGNFIGILQSRARRRLGAGQAA